MGSSTKYVLKQVFKILLIIVLLIALFVIGLMIGYGMIGDGEMNKVFEQETWTHIRDFFK
ncbi:DNA-directed RNA polymerase subunit beta [Vagococcus intermedius]|uniref:DNA-directed RNA polymerase subunit beta n=1 Tax=Vagococcus intermedius TaxID=2991418 RepID=A0AAF0I8F4_9ENTE|nr:DNA-directed RNA polymerase subunit beta [Vagococcus intermedius]WEG74099.1 DNA-directed RNA polymerase subunit beta [Vagococcus intermedius]WEG76179.1 DNA-directed RNA polymerase subunit beta [Vagococcus intermedius]